MRRLILASTSKYRRELLSRLGLPFESHAPLVDEEAVKARMRDPESLVRHLARAKAESLAPRFPEALILGSDQAVDLDGEILGKPPNEEAAVRQLLRLAGREHRLLTAVALHDAATGRTDEALDVHRLWLRPVSEAEARAYVARDRPLDCAGAYRVETLGISLMERISGDDFTAVIGLPLTRVTELLARFGVPVLLQRKTD